MLTTFVSTTPTSRNGIKFCRMSIPVLNSKHCTDLYSQAASSARVRSKYSEYDDTCSKITANHSIEIVQYPSNPYESSILHTFVDASSLSTYLSTRGRSSGLEIIFLHQQNSWSPLDASKEMVLSINDHYKFSSGFLHTISSFRNRPRATERAFCGTVRTASTSDTYEIGYVYKYAEWKNVRGGTPWRIRQTGVYHQYDQSRSSSTLVVLSPRPNAEFKIRIQETLKDSASRARALSNPVVLHTMLVSTHLSSWRDYLEFYEDHLLKADSKATGATIGEPLVSLTTLKDVRAVEKHLLPLDAILKSLQRSLVELSAMCLNLQSRQIVDGSSAHVLRVVLLELETEALSYAENATYILRRAQSVAQSVSDTLNLNFQEFAQGQSNNTFTLAKLARQDSVAIKALTLVTAFYLPFSFVATIFGMNLVAFDTKSQKLLLSRHLWLYFVISVPLTILTLACWKWKMSKRRNDDGIDNSAEESDGKTEEV